MRQIIPPLAVRSGQLWAVIGQYRLILYPFIEGKDVYQVNLSEGQWVEFGRALRQVHSARVPPALAQRIPRETYPSRWREAVRSIMLRLDEEMYRDPVAARAAAFLRGVRPEILDLVQRAERNALELQARPVELTICHSDLHAGNVLVAPGGEIFIVDWDNPIFAPKERDLMYAGGAQFNAWRTPQEEERLFYQGYGQVPVDPAALVYYRCERIVTDVALFCDQLLLSDEGGEDREQALKYLISNFDPEGTIEAAYRGDKT
jgi:spectinomycin phosphotransferase